MELKKILVGLEGIKAKGNVDLEIKGIEVSSSNLLLQYFSFIIFCILINYLTKWT